MNMKHIRKLIKYPPFFSLQRNKFLNIFLLYKLKT